MPGLSRSRAGTRYSTDVVAAHEVSAQEASAHEAVAQEASLQEALAHEALDQEALAQEALDQEALDHEALDHEALAHEASAAAALDQPALSKTLRPVAASVVTNGARAAFGFGGLVTAAAAAASTTPTPRAPGAVYPEGTAAFSIRAPFTWSGVHVGWSARMYAAAPETTGAANEVPDIHM
jgi:hypothetical protein